MSKQTPGLCSRLPSQHPRLCNHFARFLLSPLRRRHSTIPLFPLFWHAGLQLAGQSHNAWQTSAPGCLRTTWSSTSTRLSSSSCQGRTALHMDLLVTVEDAVVGPSSTARNLGVIPDDRPHCTSNHHRGDPIPADMLSTTSAGSDPSSRGKQRSSWAERSPISHLDYCNSLLAGLPASAITPLQRIQNMAVWLVYNLPKFSHMTLSSATSTAPCSGSHQIQDDGTDLQGCQRNRPDPPPSTSQTPRPG